MSPMRFGAPATAEPMAAGRVLSDSGMRVLVPFWSAPLIKEGSCSMICGRGSVGVPAVTFSDAERDPGRLFTASGSKVSAPF